MRSIAIALAFVASCTAAQARGHQAETYVNRDGVVVRRPVHASQPPSGATAQCRDGTYSFSLHRRGTCSYHHGVMRWL